MINFTLTINGKVYNIGLEGGAASGIAVSAAPVAAAPAAAAAGKIKVEAPVIGKIWKIVTAVGDTVEAGDEICILESMKMEIPVVAPEAGTIVAFNVKEGDAIEVGDVIATLE